MNMKKIVGIAGIAFLGSVLGIIGFSLLVKPEVKYIQQEEKPPVQFSSIESPGLGMTDFRVAAQLSVDAVVHVTSTKFLEQNRYRNMREYFNNEPSMKEKVPQKGYGSGVIVSPDGYIVTNNHVIDGADEIKIRMNDGSLLDAKLVGTDPNTDVAVVKVKEEDLPFLIFGDSDELQLGDWVLAVGNPWSLGTTVTAGIVSAKARDIDIIGTEYRRDRNGRMRAQRDPNAIESFIQTDAVVNAGNSGGALVNLRGELVGINTALASPTGAYSGYSFAIPSFIAKIVMQDIIEFGEVKRGVLGVTIVSVNVEFAELENLEVSEGIYVSDLAPDGGANEAGMKKGDVILSVNDFPVLNSAQLQEQVMRYGPGDEVKVEVDRKGSNKFFNVVLKNHEVDSGFWGWLGADLVNLNEEDLERMDISHGVQVAKINDGVFKRNRVPEKFVITEINKATVENKQDVKRLIDSIKEGVVLIEGILPNGRYEYFTFRK